ncbi:MAG: hypothetical protein GQE15_12680 [Archangiaceae bacterium]|nr:hypothetical protein [Archangiaceae bacterium]
MKAHHLTIGSPRGVDGSSTVVMQQPLDALDKACLAATRAPWSSFAPTWKLDLSGVIDLPLMQRALDAAVARTPWCAASIVNGAWVVPEHPRLIISTTTVEQAVLDRFIDVASEPVMEVLLLRHTDTRATLLFHQHHVLADGRAFLQLLGDFFHAWRSLESGTSPRTELVARRRQVELVSAHGLARAWVFCRGAFVSLGELARAVLSPVAALPSNVGTDYSGSNATLHHDVPLSRLEGWRTARTKLGLSTNDLLAGALLRALSMWSGQTGTTHTLFFPIDARPREGFDSFANHLTNLQLRWRTDAASTPLDYAHHVHREAAKHLDAKWPWLRVLFDAFVGQVTPLPTMQRALLDQRRLVTNVSFSNLLPLGTPDADATGRWSTRHCTVERLRITTPCVPPQAVNVTVARSGDAACFNFNFKASAIEQARVAALVNDFQRALDELDAALISSLPANSIGR